MPKSLAYPVNWSKSLYTTEKSRHTEWIKAYTTEKSRYTEGIKAYLIDTHTRYGLYSAKGGSHTLRRLGFLQRQGIFNGDFRTAINQRLKVGIVVWLHTHTDKHTVESGMHAMESGMHAVESGMHAVESGMHAVESGMHTMESGMHAVESGMHTVESGMHTVESGMHAVESGMHAVESGMHAAESGMHAVESGMHTVESGMHAVESGMHTVETSETGHTFRRYDKSTCEKSIAWSFNLIGSKYLRTHTQT